MAGGDSGFRCSSGETTEPNTKVPLVGEAPHSVVSEDRVLAPPTAGSLARLNVVGRIRSRPERGP
jgi:hypothetical protein